MSKLKDSSITIYEALENIKNGKYVMPAFQRQYVWSMAQIEKLWDSILLDYPIATFLFWHIDENNVSEDTYFCNFLPEITFNNSKQPVSANYGLKTIDLKKTDTAILDGQQRLTSLFLSLFGNALVKQKFERGDGGFRAQLLVELDKNKAGDVEEFNSKKFGITFTNKVAKITPTQFEIKRILEEEFRNENTRAQAIENVVAPVPNDSKEYARKILNKLCEKVFEEKLIRYTEIRDMKEDDALEMFVRFNNGGKPLKKSEITMSIIEAYWASFREKIGEILKGSYAKFGIDFVIRCALMLYGDVVKSNIDKKTAEGLKKNWIYFKKTLENLEEALQSINLEVGHFSDSWNVLLPVIYSLYCNPEYTDSLDGIRAYIARAVLFTYFQSGTTGKLLRLRNNINNYDNKITVDMLETMNDLRVTEAKIDDILNYEKGKVTGEALYFLGASWTDKKRKYAQDHLHPYSEFDGPPPPSVSMEDWKKWRRDRDRLPNLDWLTEDENLAKADKPLVEFYESKDAERQAQFRQQALIPEGISLELEDFEEFYEKRKVLLVQEIKKLLG